MGNNELQLFQDTVPSGLLYTDEQQINFTMLNILGLIYSTETSVCRQGNVCGKTSPGYHCTLTGSCGDGMSVRDEPKRSLGVWDEAKHLGSSSFPSKTGKPRAYVFKYIFILRYLSYIQLPVIWREISKYITTTVSTVSICRTKKAI